MSEQESASLEIVKLIEGLTKVAQVLEIAADQQTTATEDLLSAVSRIESAGSENSASVAVMAYMSGLLQREMSVLRDETASVRLPQPVRGGRLRIPVTVTLETAQLDPISAYSESQILLLDGIFERLVSTEEGGRVGPALARSWDVTADGKTYVFHLRPGVHFHDGSELTSDDVRYSFERAIRESRSGAYIFTSVVGAREARGGARGPIRGITAPTPLTVEVELEEPIAFFLEMLSLMDAAIVPRRAVEADYESFVRNPIGTGPFRFVTMDETGVRLRRNDEYRMPEWPYLDEIEYVFNVGGDAAIDGVLDGRFAFTRYVPRERLAEILANDELKSRVHWIALPQCLYFLMNATPGKLDDARVRRAIAHAIDRDALVARYNSAPIASAAQGLIPPSCPGFDPSLRGHEFDPELSRRLLSESGYDLRRPLAIRLSEGKWALGRDVANQVRSNLQDVGFRVEVTFARHLNAIRESGAYDLMEASWVADYLDPDTFTYGPFHSRFGAFGGIGSTRELDAMFESARATTDLAIRSRLYAQIHELFKEACPALVLLHRRDCVVQNEHVEGLQLIPQLPAVRARDLWIAPTQSVCP